MKFREFSDLNWRVSEVGLGCWQIGWCWGDLISDDVANKILKKALDHGLIFLIRQTLMGMVEVKYFYQISLNQPKKNLCYN